MHCLWLFAIPLVLVAVVSLAADDASARVWKAEGKQGAVAAGGKEAAAAGLAILKAGGNAIDAAVATMLVESVIDSGNFCFGGEAPIMIYDAKRGVVEVLAGQGGAPRLATLEYFQKKGGIPADGIESAAVPGAFDAMLVALDRYGTKTFADVAEPMLAALDQSQKEWSADLSATIHKLIEAEKQAGGDRRRGIRLVGDYFYRGPIARDIEAWCKEHGGLLRFSDLATHVTRIEEPVAAQYHGHTVYKCGAWTQGPSLLQSLQLLENSALPGMAHNSSEHLHVTVEALKLALADRDTYYADPLYSDVPLAALLAPKYVALRQPLIDKKHASLKYRPGDPTKGKAILDKSMLPPGRKTASRDTTTCITADSQGNIVVATPSGWGGVVAGKTGVLLGTRLQSLNTWRGHPNCLEAGKRPRITLSPTLVFDGKQPVLAVSVAGGDLQDQVSLQVVLNCLDFKLSAADAVTAPRFSTEHHIGSFRQPPPALGSLTIHEGVGDKTLAELKGLGHHITTTKNPIGTPIVLRIDPQTGMKSIAGDPQTGRDVAAY